jgi:hypothetical protein
MKFKIFNQIFILLVIISSCNFQSKEEKVILKSTNQDLTDDTKNLIDGFGDKLFLQALFYNKLNESLKMNLPKGGFCNGLNDSIDLKLKKRDSYIKLIDKKLSLIKEKKHVFKQIKNWCFISKTLDYPLIFNDSIDDTDRFGEIIYELKETNHLFNKYLSNENQNWESLDGCQSSDIYFDTVSYINSLSPNNQLEILAKYLKLAKDKLDKQ